MNRNIWPILIFFLFFIIFLATVQTKACADPVAVFKKTTDIVTQRFYDRTFRGLNWPELVRHASFQISHQTTEENLKIVLNNLLDLLRASHTEFLSDSDQEFWALKSVFSHDVDGAPLYQIGAWFEFIDGKWFIREIYEGSPASKSGLKTGDEVISVDNRPLQPVISFTPSKTKKNMLVEIKRSQSSKTQVFNIAPILQSFQRTMLEAGIQSAKIFKFKDKQIGYFHLWAGTNELFRESLNDAVARFASSTDAMVLDLRGGLGGANPEYLNQFFSKDFDGNTIQQIYTKPIVVIVNKDVRSGKEWLAYIIKNQNRGPLVGTNTKGYFLGGQYNEIVPNKYILYLAVEEAADLPKLEGVGVPPDINVEHYIPYSNGSDNQLSRAVAVASSLISP